MPSILFDGCGYGIIIEICHTKSWSVCKTGAMSICAVCKHCCDPMSPERTPFPATIHDVVFGTFRDERWEGKVMAKDSSTPSKKD